MPKDDDVNPIPSISASRDSSRSAAVPRPRGGSRTTNNGSDGGAGRTGPLAGVLIGLSLLVALGACVWAWQLQERLVQTGHTLERAEKRIGDLEDRLADTDEGMSQNAAVQAAKIRELDSEVRKLWDNVWKRSRERLGVLEASAKRFEGSIGANAQAVAGNPGGSGRGPGRHRAPAVRFRRP